MFLLHHHLNGLVNENLCSVQKVMRASEPDADKYKNVCEDFPNLGILTKSSTPGGIHLTFGHAAVGKKSLGESFVAFALAGDLSSTSLISFNIKIAFATNNEKIRLPIAEVFLCVAAGNLARSKKQRDWTSRKAVLLPPFLTEAAILHGDSDAGELLNIFTRSITEWALDANPSSEAIEASDNNSVVTIEAAEAKKPGKAKQASDETKNPGKAKQASTETAAAKTMASIADNCNNILAFLQVIAVKSTRFLVAPLSLRADKRVRVWFQRWTDVNLLKPPTPAPQDHLGFTGGEEARQGEAGLRRDEKSR